MSPKKSKNKRFVVHEHWATHHHFDLRLEIDRVLKSWAIPKQIPTEINEKRLAVAVPDHALSYIDFEGEIEEGSYGAGKVKIWDCGEFIVHTKENKIPVSLKEMLENGVLDLEFFGKKMHGHYSLVRMKLKKKQDEWLLIKL